MPTNYHGYNRTRNLCVMGSLLQKKLPQIANKPSQHGRVTFSIWAFFFLGRCLLLCICVRVISCPQNVFFIQGVLTVLCFTPGGSQQCVSLPGRLVCFTLKVAFLLLRKSYQHFMVEDRAGPSARYSVGAARTTPSQYPKRPRKYQKHPSLPSQVNKKKAVKWAWFFFLGRCFFNAARTNPDQGGAKTARRRFCVVAFRNFELKQEARENRDNRENEKTTKCSQHPGPHQNERFSCTVFCFCALFALLARFAVFVFFA